ncbi:MAG: hypothetical protein SPK26_12565 [Treponema sp.]|nr:hypothetical protein [Treponema sp.]
MDFTIVMFSWIVAIAIAIIILCFIASKMCEVASLKGYEPAKKHIFAICFWLGIFGYFYVLALPDLKLRKLLGEKEETENVDKESKNDSSPQNKVTVLENGVKGYHKSTV